MNKVLVIGGFVITGLGILALALFLFAVFSDDMESLDKDTKSTLGIIIVLCVGLMCYQGHNFIEQGLQSTASGMEKEK